MPDSRLPVTSRPSVQARSRADPPRRGQGLAAHDAEAGPGGQGHQVVEARDEPEAVPALRQGRPAVVLTDLRLPIGDGFGVLRAARNLDPELPVIVMTAVRQHPGRGRRHEGGRARLPRQAGRSRSPAAARRAGAGAAPHDHGVRAAEGGAGIPAGAPQIVGEDPALKQVIVSLQRAAATDATVLLEGESGTGKELFARAIHALSARAPTGRSSRSTARRFPTPCSRPSSSVTRRGRSPAPSRASSASSSSRTAGRCSSTRSATSRWACRASSCAPWRNGASSASGARRSLQVDVRHCRRHQQVAARGDGGAPVPRGPVLPPVGVSDHDPAAARSAGRHSAAGAALHRALPQGSQEEAGRALAGRRCEELARYPWPGNVRELQNCIERAAILADGDTIYPRHLNLTFPAAATAEEPGPRGRVDLSGTLAEASRRVLSRGRDATRSSRRCERGGRQPGRRRSCRSPTRPCWPSSGSTGFTSPNGARRPAPEAPASCSPARPAPCPVPGSSSLSVRHHVARPDRRRQDEMQPAARRSSCRAGPPRGPSGRRDRPPAAADPSSRSARDSASRSSAGQHAAGAATSAATSIP